MITKILTGYEGNEEYNSCETCSGTKCLTCKTVFKSSNSDELLYTKKAAEAKENSTETQVELKNLLFARFIGIREFDKVGTTKHDNKILVLYQDKLFHLDIIEIETNEPFEEVLKK